MKARLLVSVFIMAISVVQSAIACTSAIVSAKVSKCGHTLMWKHRDTSNSDNYVDTVNAKNGCFGYIALFNATDSLKREAWAGVNSVGFAIMNTVAGNLPPNNKDHIDCEGLVMTEALKRCSSVSDFEKVLDTLPKPLGVRTNFGVIDSNGNGAYFETSDWDFVKYDVADSDNGSLIRSNFAMSGGKKGGYGYDRYDNAQRVVTDAIASNTLTSETFTEFLSRKFYSAKTNNCITDNSNCAALIRDRGFIPRPSSASSVVIELTDMGPIMWVMLGYPPAAITHGTTPGVAPPPALQRNNSTGRSSECDATLNRKKKITDGKNISVCNAREISSKMEKISRENYLKFRLWMQKQ